MHNSPLFYRNLTTALETLGTSLNKISEHIHRPPSTLTRYYNKHDESAVPQQAVIADVARFLGVSQEDMLTRCIAPSEFSMNPLPDDYKEQVAMINAIPVYTAYDIIDVALGKKATPKEFTSPAPLRRHKLVKGMFAYNVLGNAFAPVVRHGDLTFCFPFATQAHVRDGALILACNTLGAPTQPSVLFGYLKFGVNGDKHLQALDGNLTPIADKEIIGVVAVNCTEYN